MADAAAEADLARLLANAAQDPAERPAFVAALLEADVYVLGHLDRPTVGGVAPAGSALSITSIQFEGRAVTPFFTSPEMVEVTLARRPGTDPRYVGMACRSLLELTRGTRLLLNPDGPHGKLFEPAEVAALLEGREPGVDAVTITEEEPLLVGAPAELPDELIPTLARFLVQRPPVESARLGWVQHPDGQEAYLLALVSRDRDAAMAGFGTLDVLSLTNGRTMEVVVEDPDWPQHLLEGLPPFYVRRPQPDVPA